MSKSMGQSKPLLIYKIYVCQKVRNPESGITVVNLTKKKPHTIIMSKNPHSEKAKIPK